MNERSDQTPEFLFSARNGAHVQACIETILNSSEVERTEAEKTELTQFAEGLFEGSYQDLEAGVSQNLEAIHTTETKTHRQSYYLDYFLTEKGKADLALLGLPQDASEEVIVQTLTDVSYISGRLETKTRKQISHRSVSWHKHTLAEHLLDDPTEEAGFEAYRKVEVNYNPDKLLGKIDELRRYRRFYGRLKRQLRGGDQTDGSVDAKQALLAVYTGRVNHLLTEMYPVALSLAQQLQRSTPSDQIDLWINRLSSVAPFIAEVYDAVDATEREQTLARRFDFIRNGVADSGGLTPLSDEIRTFLGKEQSTQTLEGLIPPDVLAEMDATTWDAEQLKGFLEAVLEDWGKLSAEQVSWDVVDKREGFAPDGLYQVIISPKKNNLEVLSAKRVMVVPDKFKRTLTSAYPAGALPVSAHELAHVLQSFADRELGKAIPLAKIKGRRFATLREAGGLYQEQVMQAVYFGRTRPTNPHYARALEAKLSGANNMQVVRAFYDSYVDTLDSPDEEALQVARQLAVDRAMRLYREAGYNTQPLDYIEQGLIANELLDLPHDQINSLIIGGSSFNLHDSALLHRVGLLEIPTTLEHDPVHDVMKVFFEQSFAPSTEQVQ